MYLSPVPAQARQVATLKFAFIVKLKMLPSFTPQVGEITVHVLRTSSRYFIKLKTRRDF